MAISWSAYDGHVRVGIELMSWTEGDGSGAVDHESTQAQVKVKVYTGVDNWSFNDSQTLNLSGSGFTNESITFQNTQGANTTVLRATRTFEYNYSSSSYGSSPGSRTWTAALTGVYTEGDPTKSVSSSIPARPYDKPAAPTGATTTRVSDTSTKVNWANHPTTGEPYNTITLQRSINGASWVTVSSSISGSATTYANGTTTNTKYKFRVRANNSEGSSAWAETGDIYTTPSAPTSCARAGANGEDQIITWSNNSPGYSEYKTEIYRNTNGAEVLAATVNGGVTSWTDPTVPSAGDTVKYRVRHRTEFLVGSAYLYSGYTSYTTSTSGAASAPDAPTNLGPSNSVAVNGSKAKVFTWTYNTSDGTAQTGFQIQHRLAGNAWPGSPQATVASSASSWTLPASTYSNGQTVEWQVRTKGADAAYSAWSSTATFVTSEDRKVPLAMNLSTGLPEVDVTGESWKTPTLLNGWVDYGSTWQGARYRRLGGVVYIQGLVKSGTASTVFNLPAGYRPAAALMFSTMTYSRTSGGASDATTGPASAGTAHTHEHAHTHDMTNHVGRLDIKANGDVIAGAFHSNWISISCSFPAEN